jgi:hypothetical protein
MSAETLQSLPPHVPVRLALARQRGYLVTNGVRGVADWLDTCRLLRRPFVLVARDGKTWRLRIEMEGWTLTADGQQAMQCMLAEHGATHITVLPDAVYGYKLQLWQTEIIAARFMTWVREAEARRAGEVKEARR